jgi:hypothetical protein
VSVQLRLQLLKKSQFSVAGSQLKEGNPSVVRQDDGTRRDVVLKFQGVKPEAVATL